MTSQPRSKTPRVESILEIASRTLVIGAVGYATLMYGAVDASTQLVACVLVLVATVLMISRRRFATIPNQPWLMLISAAWLAWLLLTWIATVRLPENVVTILAPATQTLRNALGPVGGQDSVMSLAIIPSKTASAWAIHAIAFACFLVGATAFRSRRHRDLLFGSVMTIGVLFAAWGLVNRSRGTAWLLPGVESPDGSHPFSTMVYKNAGGAMLVLSLAAAIGFLLERLRPVVRDRIRLIRRHADRSRRHQRRSDNQQSGSRETHPRTGYSHVSYWTEPQFLLMLTVIALLGVGIAFSLSRGIWIVTVLVLASWLLLTRRFFSKRMMVAATVFLTCTFALIAFGLLSPHDMIDRAQQIDFDTLAANDRFSHWFDSTETLLNFAIVGSGLGSYGYVQLPHQAVDTPRWFEHAHNMPLEWAIETGILGILVLCLGLFAVSALLRDLYHRRFQSTVFVTSFSVGFVASVAILLQSLFDFTILTPAVFWTFALLLGAVSATTADHRSGSRSSHYSSAASIRATEPTSTSGPRGEWDSGYRPRPQSLGVRWMRHASNPLPWAAISAVGLLLAQSALQQKVVNDRLLAESMVPLELPPSMTRIQSTRQHLVDRIEQGTLDGRLHQRLAQWDLAAFRRQLMEDLKSPGEHSGWAETTPEALFQKYYQSPIDRRDALVCRWLRHPEAKQNIESCAAQLDRSLSCNPLVPQIHLQQALLTLMTGREIERSLENASLLSASNGELQFQIGQIAFWIDDIPRMIEHWQRCLVYSPEHTALVLQLAQSVLSPTEITQGILARVRPNVWVSLVKRSKVDPQLESFQQAFAEEALRTVRNATTLPESRRHYLAGRVLESRGNYGAAAIELQRAVDLDRRNVDYRRRLALNLWRDGSLDLAREQLVFAAALHPGDTGLTYMLERIERQLQKRFERQSGMNPHKRR